MIKAIIRRLDLSSTLEISFMANTLLGLSFGIASWAIMKTMTREMISRTIRFMTETSFSLGLAIWVLYHLLFFGFGLGIVMTTIADLIYITTSDKIGFLHLEIENRN